MFASKLMEKHGASFEEVINKLVMPVEAGMSEIELYADQQDHQAKFSFDEEHQKMFLQAPGIEKKFDVDFKGFSKAMRLSGFAESVINSYPVRVMIEPLNYGFNKKTDGPIKAFVKDDRIVAFVKPTLELVSTEDLLRIAAQVCGSEAIVERFSHDLSYTNCSIVMGNMHREWDDERLVGKSDSKNYGFKKDDVILGGINFQNSIMGEYGLELSSYVYRLACSNGMVSVENRFKWSRKTAATPLTEWFTEGLTACTQSLTHEFDKIEHLRSLTVETGNKAKILSNLFAEYDLSDKMRQAVLSRLTEESPRHMWDIVNAITNIANDEDYKESPHTVRMLQKTGGDIATNLHVCDVCHAVSRN